MEHIFCLSTGLLYIFNGLVRPKFQDKKRVSYSLSRSQFQTWNTVER